MTLKQFLFFMSVATALCWVAWGIVLVNVDPFVADTLGILFFYLSLGLALVGSISLIAVLVRNVLADDKTPFYRHVRRSFTDGVIAAVFICFVMWLWAMDWLNVWNFSTMLFIGLCIVLFQFTNKKRTPNIHS